MEKYARSLSMDIRRLKGLAMTTRLLSAIMGRPVISIYTKNKQLRFISEIKGKFLSPNKLSDKPVMPLNKLMSRAQRKNILKETNLKMDIDKKGKWYTVRIGHYLFDDHRYFESLTDRPFTSPDRDKALLKAYEFAINYNQPESRTYAFDTEDSGLVVRTLNVGDTLYGIHGEYEWENDETAPKPYCYEVGTVTEVADDYYCLQKVNSNDIEKRVVTETIPDCMLPMPYIPYLYAV